MRVTPVPQEPVNRNLRRERRRWDEGDALPLALGCVACADRETCGGIRKKQDHFSCLDDCCGNPATCDSMCPRNLAGFIQRTREVNGLDLNNIPRAVPCVGAGIPPYIPYLFHGNRRDAVLDVPFVALPLHKFYRRRDGAMSFSNRAEIDEAFRLAPHSRIILVGSGRDRPIEAWWGLSEKRQGIIAELKKFGIDLVTSPNYSLFTDEVRYNDMYNMKRIGLAWQEFVGQSVPSAYHLNARTPHDYLRLAEFINGREEITDVSFEFKTGAAWPQRRGFHLDQLAQLAGSVGHTLRLFMVGGVTAIPVLAPAFAHLTYIDTTAFMSALHRQRLYLGNDGLVKKQPELTGAGLPVDLLLSNNIEIMRRRVEAVINASQSKTTSLAGSEPPQENPETETSELGAPSLGQAAGR